MLPLLWGLRRTKGPNPKYTALDSAQEARVSYRFHMRSITTIPSLVLFFFFFGGTPGTPTNVKPQADPGLRLADSTVASWVAAEKVPGAVLLVSRRGETVLKVAYGSARLFEYQDGEYQAHPGNPAIPGSLRRLNKPEPMTAVKVFDLASVTKVMATTMAIMMLVDRGQVYLDSPVSTYLPDFSGAEKEHITVRHLLTHRSGLPQWLPIYYHAGNTEDAYDYIRRLQLAWPIGLQRHYSDLGFMLLGLIVEQVSRNPLDTFLDNELYTPLGLSSTGFQPTGARDEAKDDGAFAATSHGNPYEHRMIYDPAFGYRIEVDPDTWDGWRTYTLSGEVNDGNAFHTFGGVAGHAGLFSSATDLRVLLQLLLDEGEYENRRYMSAEVIKTFFTDTGDGQALGWQIPTEAPHGSFSHTGFTGTFVLGVPEEDLAVVLLTNRQNSGVGADGMYSDIGPLQQAISRALTEQRGGPTP